MKKEIVLKINDAILREMEKGKIPWEKPWSPLGSPFNPLSGTRYKGCNHFYLSLLAFDRPFFMTFVQARDAGGNIKKGAKSHPILYWSQFKKQVETPEGTADQMIPCLKYYNVFNIDEVEGIDWTGKLPERREIPFNPIEKADQVVKAMPLPPGLRHAGDSAHYTPALDQVTMPSPKSFKSEENYYGVLFHELSHSTGHKSRLNRPEIKDPASFGSETYAKEELVAELSSAYVMQSLGLSSEGLVKNSAAYLQGWMKAIKKDSMLFIKASFKADKSAKWILNQREEE